MPLSNLGRFARKPKEKPTPPSETIRQRLADVQRKIEEAALDVQRTALAVETGDSDGKDYEAAAAALRALRDEAERLAHALPAAERREAEEAEAARSAEEKRRADDLARANEARHRAGRKHVATFQAAVAPIPSLCTQLATAVAAAEKAMRAVWPLVPDDAPSNAGYSKFAPSHLRTLIADELARAGKAAEVNLPGASTEPAVETFAAAIDAVASDTNDHLYGVIIEGKRDQSDPVNTITTPPSPPPSPPRGQVVLVKRAEPPGTIPPRQLYDRFLRRLRPTTEAEKQEYLEPAYRIIYPDGSSIPAPPPAPGVTDMWAYERQPDVAALLDDVPAGALTAAPKSAATPTPDWDAIVASMSPEKLRAILREIGVDLDALPTTPTGGEPVDEPDYYAEMAAGGLGRRAIVRIPPAEPAGDETTPEPVEVAVEPADDADSTITVTETQE